MHSLLHKLRLQSCDSSNLPTLDLCYNLLIAPLQAEKPNLTLNSSMIYRKEEQRVVHTKNPSLIYKAKSSYTTHIYPSIKSYSLALNICISWVCSQAFRILKDNLCLK